MPVYDWECTAHGVFEAFVGKCPHGCGPGMVKRLSVLKMNIGRSDKTKFIDKTLKDMSKEYGMTDFNNRGGQNGFEEGDRKMTTQQKRILGQSYSVPIGENVDIGSIAGMVGASTDGNIAATMKQEGRLKFEANVVRDDGVRLKPSDIK